MECHSPSPALFLTNESLSCARLKLRETISRASPSSETDMLEELLSFSPPNIGTTTAGKLLRRTTSSLCANTRSRVPPESV